jgi:hypothetical protein
MFNNINDFTIIILKNNENFFSKIEINNKLLIINKIYEKFLNKKEISTEECYKLMIDLNLTIDHYEKLYKHDGFKGILKPYNQIKIYKKEFIYKLIEDDALFIMKEIKKIEVKLKDKIEIIEQIIYGFFIKPEYLIKQYVLSNQFLNIIKSTKILYEMQQKMFNKTNSFIFNNTDRYYELKEEILKMNSILKFCNDGSAHDILNNDICNLKFQDNLIENNLNENMVFSLIGSSCKYSEFSLMYKKLLNEELQKVQNTTFGFQINKEDFSKNIEEVQKDVKVELNINIFVVQDMICTKDMCFDDGVKENKYKNGINTMKKINKLEEFFTEDMDFKEFEDIYLIQNLCEDILSGKKELFNFFSYRESNEKDIIPCIKSNNKNPDGLHFLLSIGRVEFRILENILYYIKLLKINEESKSVEFEKSFYEILIKHGIYNRNDIYNEKNNFFELNDRRFNMPGDKLKKFLDNKEILDQILILFKEKAIEKNNNYNNYENNKNTLINYIKEGKNNILKEGKIIYDLIKNIKEIIYTKFDETWNEDDIIENYRNFAKLLDALRFKYAIIGKLIDYNIDYLSIFPFIFVSYVKNFGLYNLIMENDENLNKIIKKNYEKNSVKKGGGKKSIYKLKDLHNQSNTIAIDKNNNFIFQSFIRLFFKFMNYNYIKQNINDISITTTNKYNLIENNKFNFKIDKVIPNNFYENIQKDINKLELLSIELNVIEKSYLKSRNTFIIEENNINFPDNIKKELENYQKKNIEKIYFNLKKNRNSFLTFEQGLGKTVVVIILCYLFYFYEERPVLYITPPSLLKNFLKEENKRINKFVLPNLNPIIIKNKSQLTQKKNLNKLKTIKDVKNGLIIVTDEILGLIKENPDKYEDFYNFIYKNKDLLILIEEAHYTVCTEVKKTF